MYLPLIVAKFSEFILQVVVASGPYGIVNSATNLLSGSSVFTGYLSVLLIGFSPEYPEKLKLLCLGTLLFV